MTRRNEERGFFLTEMRIIFTAFRSLIFASGFVGLWTWVALLIRRRYDLILQIDFPSWVGFVGLALIFTGATIALSCVVAFIAVGKGTPAPFDAPRKFVAVGPYRFVRNPMYIGAFLTISGFGLYIHSLPVLIFGLPWVLMANIFVILYEEPTLRKKFGSPYEDYCQKVNRWIPKNFLSR
jgi:protein-S-isoprenylcysteine O-methyltransferase Ste14